jgi:hypothetical protein
MKAVFLILILGLALAFVLTGGRSADAQGVRMCADRSINGTPVHECYDGAQRNVTLSNNCGTIQMSAQALSDGDIPSIVPCPRTSSSSSRVAPQRHPDPGPTEDERKCQISVDAFSGDTPAAIPPQESKVAGSTGTRSSNIVLRPAVLIGCQTSTSR